MENYKANQTWKSYRAHLVHEVLKKRQETSKGTASKRNHVMNRQCDRCNQKHNPARINNKKSVDNKSHKTYHHRQRQNILKLPLLVNTIARNSLSVPTERSTRPITDSSFLSSDSSSTLLVLSTVPKDNEKTRGTLTTNDLKIACI